MATIGHEKTHGIHAGICSDGRGETVLPNELVRPFCSPQSREGAQS